jgi:sigma-E processing peptidase SpoIIGA
MTVYVELVLIENFIVDYFILLICAKMTLLPAKHPFLAAGFGAVYACVMPLWQPFQTMVLKIVVLLAMLAICFRQKKGKAIVSLTLTAFLLTCALYGAVKTLLPLKQNLFADTGMMLYSDHAVIYLVLCSAFCAFLLYKSASAFFARRRLKENTARLILGDRGARAEIKALVDSGNSLYYKDTPVVLVERKALGRLENLPVQPLVIPFHSVENEGALIGFFPEKATVVYEEKTVELKCVVAICDHGFQNGFGALLHPDLIRECV